MSRKPVGPWPPPTKDLLGWHGVWKEASLWILAPDQVSVVCPFEILKYILSRRVIAISALQATLAWAESVGTPSVCSEAMWLWKECPNSGRRSPQAQILLLAEWHWTSQLDCLKIILHLNGRAQCFCMWNLTWRFGCSQTSRTAFTILMITCARSMVLG